MKIPTTIIAALTVGLTACAVPSQVVKNPSERSMDELCAVYTNPKAEPAQREIIEAEFARRGIHWSEEHLALVRGSNAKLGMPADALRCSWGPPDHINSAASLYGGAGEQWVYPRQNAYFYIEGGRVVAKN